MKEDIINLETRLGVYAGEDRMISSLELKAKLDSEPQNQTSFTTKIPTIDKLLSGVESGELIVVSGPTGSGKTTLLTSITSAIASEVKCAWFTLEVTQRQFIAKFQGKLPLFYTPAKNTDNNVKWLIDRIIEAKLKYNINMVFIDHLHQLFSIDRFNGKNLSLEIGDIVAKIKQLAIEYDLVIWLIAHNTDNKMGASREPKMFDIRDSGMISRLADIVIGIWRIKNSNNGRGEKLEDLDEWDTRSKVRIWKNRRTGKLGHLVMLHENGILTELDTTLEQQEDDTYEVKKDKYYKRNE